MRFTLCLLMVVAALLPGVDHVRGQTPPSTPQAHIAVPDIHSLKSDQPTVWMRCFVQVPASWAVVSGFQADSVTLTVENVVDACEVFVNGTRVGACGSLPPEFRHARDQSFRFKIPPGTLRPDAYNCVVFRMYGDDGRVGFNGRAPVLAGYHSEIPLHGDWLLSANKLPEMQFRAITPRPPHAVFDKTRPASSPLSRTGEFSPGKLVAPQDSLAAMHVADDLAVDLVLHEPLVAQPLSLDFDNRGRLWVVQYRQYPYPAGVKMISRDKYYRSAYDRIPPAPPNHDRGADRITIHEDTDGDGKFDEHKVFVDGLNMVSAVELAHDGIWVLNPPYLLFFPDHDGDDNPDGDPQVHLAGFGLEDTHSIANSLTWGPDGWLYAAQGSTTSSRVKVVGTDQPEVYRDGAMIWRYHPKSRRYEVFAEGGGNAFGIEIDSKGRLYSGHNGGDTRGFYYMQGGYFRKGEIYKYGPVSNPHAYGELPQMEHDPTPRFTHDFVKYEGVGLPEDYHGKLFCVDPMHRKVVLAEIKPRGASFRTKDVGAPLTSDDPTFRPIDVTVGPDGALYIADFCEEFIAHGQHYQGQIATATGRVYRLRAKNSSHHRPLSNVRIAAQSNDQLLESLASPDRWHRNCARRRLANLFDDTAAAKLRGELRQANSELALEALWTLHLSDRLNDADAVAALHHDNPHVRRWCVRLLGDRIELASSLSDAIVALTAAESDAEALAQLACTARRMPTPASLKIIASIAAKDWAADDPYIPLLTWWALESKADDRDAVLELFKQPSVWQSPLIRDTVLERLMRRYGSGSRSDLTACARLLKLSPNETTHVILLKGFERAFEGRTFADAPAELLDALGDVGGGSLALKLRRKDSQAISSAMQSLALKELPPGDRLNIIRLLGEIEHQPAIDPLLKLLDSEQADVVTAAMVSLQNFNAPRIAEGILQTFPALPADSQQTALLTLVSREAWAQQLLGALQHQEVQQSVIPAEVVHRLIAHPAKSVAQSAQRRWPQIASGVNETSEQTLARARQAIASGDGDPYAGRGIFADRCVKCHVLFRDGGRIGPDLTAYQRADTPRMLLHVVQPSVEIREGFETYQAITIDGRIVSGFLFDQDANAVVLRAADGQSVTLPRDDIDELSRAPRSIMPTGLLDDLTDQQIRDLFAYMRISQPLNEP